MNRCRTIQRTLKNAYFTKKSLYFVENLHFSSKMTPPRQDLTLQIPDDRCRKTSLANKNIQEKIPKKSFLLSIIQMINCDIELHFSN